MKTSRSISTRIIRNFLTLMCITIVVINLLLGIYVRNYYYSNIEQTLKNQIKLAISYYEKYFSLSNLEERIYDNIDSFWDETNAQVQIIDNEGNLLLDSIGVSEKNLLKYEDVEKAVNGELGKWVGKVDYYDNTVMAVSSPLIANGNMVGVIRYITSMENIDNGIRGIITSLLIISVVVLICTIIICIYIANSISSPIKEITKIAEEMANGNMAVRSKEHRDMEINKLATTLNFMADEIIKKDKLKNEFISSVSHELRTPLTSIKGWAITINQDTTDKEIVDLGVNIIEKEADRLTVMVEELLDFSKLVNGKITLRKDNIKLKELVNYTKHSFNQRAKMENKNFNVKDELQDVSAIIDLDRMKQVILNVIDNSFKFTEENESIEVIFKIVNNMLDITIIDTGHGINDEELPKVKERFFKGKNSKAKNGIGLSICDEIIGMHNGNFVIESKYLEGTKITIQIPLKEDEI
ncbi:MAG: sensor histidine kinase [Clostridium sp.]